MGESSLPFVVILGSEATKHLSSPLNSSTAVAAANAF
jgi:hypothetical protein